MVAETVTSEPITSIDELANEILEDNAIDKTVETPKKGWKSWLAKLIPKKVRDNYQTFGKDFLKAYIAWDLTYRLTWTAAWGMGCDPIAAIPAFLYTPGCTTIGSGIGISYATWKQAKRSGKFVDPKYSVDFTGMRF